MDRRKTIAVVMGPWMACYREMLRAISEYARTNRDWHVEYYTQVDNFCELIQETTPQGLILGLVFNPDEAAEAVRRATNTVGICGEFDGPRFDGLVQVEVDDESVGELAANYFLEKGYTQFAFIDAVATWSHRRWVGYERALAARGFTPEYFIFRRSSNPNRGWSTPVHTDDMLEWLKQLPKPIAILVSNDLRAREVIQACNSIGLRIPDDVSILGVDNDDLDCEMCNPPLSSVAIPWGGIGNRAAHLLDQLMRGDKPPQTLHRVGPINVVERQSTNTLAIRDPVIGTALRFIRENAHRPIGVEDILETVPISRRAMESSFKKLLNRTPLDEIKRVRLEIAKHLLLETTMPIPDVAAKSGFGNAAWFSKVFHDEAGMTPTQFRKSHQK